MKRHLQCAEPQASPSNLTKYCACHAKWLSWLIFVTYGTSFTMRGATGITLQPHQILRLPRKSALQNLSEILRERLKRQFQCAADSTMIRTWSEHDPSMNSSSRTRPFAEVTFRASETHFVLKITTFRAPAIFSNFTEYCACHEKWHSDITKYCSCHEKWCASLIVVAYETSFTMRGATGIALQPHQILRLPRKMTLMIDLRHIWNVIYNARSNRHHPPTSPNTAPATQKCTPKPKRNSPRTVEAPIPMRGRFDHDPNMIRTWSEHDPTMNSSSRTRPFAEVTFRASETHFVLKITTFRAPAIFSNFTEYCACHEKWHSDITKYTAPATKNDAHHWLSSHMKRLLQCAEPQASPSNLTKYCACHAKWLSWLIFVTYGTSFTMRGATGITLQPHQILRLPRKSALQNLSEILRERLKRQFQCAADSNMIRTRSDHDPTMIRPWSDHELVISHPPVRRGYFSRFGDAFCIENYNISRSGYLPRFHRILRLPQKVTLQDHQILRLPRKMILMIDIRDIWNVIYNARSNKHHPPTSPNTAPATEKESHLWSSSHMKRHLQCAEQQASPSNLTKCCPCHETWCASLMVVTYETSFTMHGATGITLQPHQILRLPRKSALQNLREIVRKQLKCHLQCAADSNMIRTRSDHDPTMIRPWSDHELVISHPPVRRGYFSRFGDAFCIENYNISRSGYLPRFHRILRLPQKVTLQDHQILHLPRKVPLQDHEILRLPRKVPLQGHQILRLPRKVTLICDSTELLLNCYWAVTELLLSCYWAVTELLLSCYWAVTELLLSCYWAVTELLLSCYWTVTELLLNCYWAVTELLLSCYWAVTELLLNWAVTELLLSCYWTELLLNCYWAVTELLLNCYWTVTDTELSCYWTVTDTELSCYWTVTEPLLILNWAVTELLLSCYWTVTELLLNCYWTVTDTELSCYWAVTELLLNWTELLLHF